MDYLDYFGLKEQPFTNVIDNRFYYNSQQHGEALLRLKYAVSTMKGLAVLLGGIGTGKTTLARRMLDELNEDEYESALLIIIHSQITAEWLLKKIAMQLGVNDIPEDKVNLLSRLYQRLLEIHEEGKKAVVLIDEAQMLNNRDIMEEFRGLLNLEVTGGKLVSFVFFGLPELDQILNLDEPLKQRVAVKYSLMSFPREATVEYIRHRLNVAGSDANFFEDDAMELVHNYSRGVPRLINTICDNVLLEGYLTKRSRIDCELVEQIAVDFGLTM